MRLGGGGGAGGAGGGEVGRAVVEEAEAEEGMGPLHGRRRRRSHSNFRLRFISGSRRYRGIDKKMLG